MLSNTALISLIVGATVFIALLIFFITLVLHVKKHGGKASGSVSDGKHTISFNLENGDESKKDNDASSSSDTSSSVDPKITGSYPTPDNIDRPHVSQMMQFLTADLCKTYKFFTSTVYQYTQGTHEFSIYDKLCADNIKKESPNVIEFKKLVAGKFIHECLFKYLCDLFTKWVKDMEAECKERIQKAEGDKSVPTAYYSCLEQLFKYREEVTRLARNLTFEFKGHVVHGIPEPFIKTLDEWSVKNMNTVNSSLNLVVYSATNNNWFSNVKEILDIYDITVGMMLNDVDATLVILNGEMKKYVEELLGTKEE